MFKTKSFIISLLLLLKISFISAQLNSVEIWMRAFIPNPQNAGQATGNILPMPNGSQGSLVRFQQTILPELINQCFATDNRGFSNDPSPTSRLETKFSISLSPDGSASITPANNRTTAAVTTKLDCSTGATIEQKIGSVTRDHLGTPTIADGVVQVIGQAQGLNLLAFLASTTSGLATPAFDYSFDIQWKPATASLIASITYGSFPAFEMYARQGAGSWVTIVQHLPTSAPWRLAADGFGINSVRVSKTVTVPSAMDGKWQSPAPEQRFNLEIVGGKAKWTERNSSGATLMRQVPIQDLGNGSFRIERANDNEVLSFLGFTQQSLRNEILALGPQPSFIIFRKEGTTFRGEWNGLIATKHLNGSLNELIQPGGRPAKVYIFSPVQ